MKDCIEKDPRITIRQARPAPRAHSPHRTPRPAQSSPQTWKKRTISLGSLPCETTAMRISLSFILVILTYRVLLFKKRENI